jgi:hypothetical protein
MITFSAGVGLLFFWRFTMDIETLLSPVQHRPLLWGTEDIDYKDKTLTTKTKQMVLNAGEFIKRSRFHSKAILKLCVIVS